MNLCWVKIHIWVPEGDLCWQAIHILNPFFCSTFEQIQFQVLAILDKIKQENEEKMEKGEADDQFQSSDHDNDDEDLDEDDINEDGIFYVK